MAQPIIEKLKVQYTQYINGEVVTGEKLLKDLSDEEKQRISSLTILPVFNSDGSLNSQKKDISGYITGFPILTEIKMPSQFERIDFNKIHNSGCPNVTTTYVYGNAGDLEKGTTVKAKGPVTFVAEQCDDPSGNGCKTIHVAPGMVKNPNPSKKKTKPFVTTSDLAKAIEDIQGKMGVIRSKVEELGGNTSRIPTDAQIRAIFNETMTGVATKEDLDELVEKFKGISTSTDVRVMEKSVTETMKGFYANLDKKYGEQQASLKALLTEVGAIYNQNISDQKKMDTAIELLRGQIPNLIATNRGLVDKVFMKLGLIEGSLDKEGGLSENVVSIKDKLEDVHAYQDLIGEFLEGIDEKVGKIQGFDENVKNFFLNSYAEYSNKIASELQQGNQAFYKDIKDLIVAKPNIEDIDKIVTNRFAEQGITFDKKTEAIKNEIIDKIINEMHDLSGLKQADLENISRIVMAYVNDPETKKIITSAVGESELLNKLSNKFNAFETALGALVTHDELSQMLEDNFKNLLTKEDFEKFINENIGKTREEIVTLIKSITNNEVFKIIQNNISETLNLTNNNSQDISEIKNNVAEISKIVLKLAESQEKTNNQAQAATVVNIFGYDSSALLGLANLQNNNQTTNIINNLRSIFNLTNNNANNNTTNIDINALINLLGVVSNNNNSRFINLSAIGGQNNIDVNMAIKLLGIGAMLGNGNNNNNTLNVVQLMAQIINNLGVNGLNIQNIADNDAVKKLQEELDNQKKEFEAFKKQTEANQQQLMDAINKLTAQIGNLAPKPNPQPQQTSQPNPQQQTPSKTQPQQPQQNPQQNSQALPQPKKPDLPKKDTKIDFIKNSIENMNRMAEPHQSRMKRLGKFIIRHPLRSAAIGLGIGAVATAGVATIALGGPAAALAAVDYFLPTVVIGGGATAATVLTAGGVGSIISHLSKGGRKERLYTKFKKQSKKCEALREKAEEMEAEMVELQEEINASRQNRANQNKLLKKLGVYKAARNAKRKKIRKLREKSRDVANKHALKVDDALRTKKELNALEDASGKTLAINGYLQKRKEIEEKYAQKASSPNLSAEDLDDIKEDREDDLEDLEEDMPGVTTLSNDYKTFDAEAEALISGVKDGNRQTQLMKDLARDIQSRNSRPKTDHIEYNDYNPTEVQKYMQYLETKGTDKEKVEFIEMLNKRRQELNQLANQGARLTAPIPAYNLTPGLQAFWQAYLQKQQQASQNGAGQTAKAQQANAQQSNAQPANNAGNQNTNGQGGMTR